MKITDKQYAEILDALTDKLDYVVLQHTRLVAANPKYPHFEASFLSHISFRCLPEELYTSLYARYNDAHINTAVKKALKALNVDISPTARNFYFDVYDALGCVISKRCIQSNDDHIAADLDNVVIKNKDGSYYQVVFQGFHGMTTIKSFASLPAALVYLRENTEPLGFAGCMEAVERGAGVWVKTTQWVAMELLGSCPPSFGGCSAFTCGEIATHNDAGDDVYTGFIKIGESYYAKNVTIDEFKNALNCLHK